MTHPLKEILMEELETVTDALAMCTQSSVQNQDDIEHWTGRLRRVNHALQALSGIITLTQQERNTLLLLIEFHDGSFGPGEEAPFDVRAAESARAKLEG